LDKSDKEMIQAYGDGVINLVGPMQDHLQVFYEVNADDSGALDAIFNDTIKPIHGAFSKDLLTVGIELKLESDWVVDTDGQYPVFQFMTKVLDGSRESMTKWYDELEIHDEVDHGLELEWNGWSIIDYTGIKTREPEVELTTEEQLLVALESAARWEAECTQRVAELEELHARIRKIKSCPRYRLGESKLGPPMFAHGRGEWIKHDDMRDAAALAVTDEQKARHELLDADRDVRKLDGEQPPIGPDVMFGGENETTG
jgi:hypothetical protein